MVEIKGNELIGLYLFLRKHQDELDTNLSVLLTKIEKQLYSTLSIKDFENLEPIYDMNTLHKNEKGSQIE